MHVHVSFDSGHARDIPASKQTLVKIEDGDHRDSFVLDGVHALYLVTDDGSPLGDVDAAEIAASIGWVSPETVKDDRAEAKRLARKLVEAEKAVEALQAEARGRGWRG